MKKIFCLLLSAVLLCSLTACGGSGGTQNSTQDSDLISENDSEAAGSAADEAPVDLDSVKTIGELTGLPDVGSACYEDTYVYAFEQDGTIYRAIADCPKVISDKIFALDHDDPDYAAKLKFLIGPLTITRIDSLTEQIPSQEELAQLAGKTGKDLFNEGWTCGGWDLETKEFYMSHGPFEFTVIFDGEFPESEDFEEEDIAPLTVRSVTFQSISDPADLE